MALPIAPVAALSPLSLGGSRAAASPQSFGAVVNAALNGLSQTTSQADQALGAALAGHGTVTGAMVAVTEAQTAIDVAAAIRNATVQAAQSFFNLQI